MTTARPGPLSQYFYLFMSLLIAAVVTYGFSHTINDNLIHATPVRPWILYLHATVFCGWVVFFVVQSALVRTRNVRVHRTLGWFGVGLATLIVVLGISTAITMARFRIFHFHSAEAAPFIAIQLWDISSFAVLFSLAIYWRRKPEYHRRLVLLASCMLTAAAFARFPQFSFRLSYVGVDTLVCLGILRDLIVTRGVQPVYRYALPLIIVGQAVAFHLFIAAPPRWVAIANAILR